MISLGHTTLYSSKKFTELHRIAFETYDRDGVNALVEGKASEAIDDFIMAERHGRKLATLLQSTEEKARAMAGSLEMSNRVANLRALNSWDSARACSAMINLLARHKREN